MMIFPNCPDHERLALDLALGRLDDAAAAEAESVSEACPICRAWWQEQFEDEAAKTVDEAVAATFADLRLPARRRGHGWMAVAAALIMTIGATTLWLARSPGSSDPVVLDRTAAIQSMDFETPENLVVHAASTTAPAEATEVVPAVSPEIEEAAIPDELVVAESAPAELPAQSEPESLFAGGFESGDLSDWVPST